MVYRVPWQKQTSPILFDPGDQVAGPSGTFAIPPELSPIPPEIGAIPPELGAIPPEQVQKASEVTVYLAWAEVPAELQTALSAIAQPVSQTRRAAPDVLASTVCSLCTGRYLGRIVLAHLLNRNPDDLLKRILNPMVESGVLKTAYPATSNPRQAYTAPISDAAENAK